jgi:hypothetical protein
MESYTLLETAILEMGRMKAGSPFLPSDVVKWIYPQDWEHFIPEVLDAMMSLYKAEKISITKNGIPVDSMEKIIDSVQITLKAKTN